MSPGAARVVASWFGVGFVPWAPGTFGTLAAVPLTALLWWAGPWWLLAVVAPAVSALGIAAADVVARQGVKDPQWVVIDEVAGYLVASALIPAGWLGASVAFVLFRVLDIVKPGPIGALEKLPGGWGVTCDDLLSGAIAGLMTLVIVGLVTGRWGPAA